MPAGGLLQKSCWNLGGEEGAGKGATQSQTQGSPITWGLRHQGWGLGAVRPQTPVGFLQTQVHKAPRILGLRDIWYKDPGSRVSRPATVKTLTQPVLARPQRQRLLFKLSTSPDTQASHRLDSESPTDIGWRR